MQDALPRSQVERAYDRVGSWQDTQRFYESRALEVLTAHSDFQAAYDVVEMGCGTGRFAEGLLSRSLPGEARYRGLDLSRAMVRTARRRLFEFGSRVSIRKTAGDLSVEGPDQSVDRVVATYLLDLLSAGDCAAFLDEAHRVLRSSGLLCLASLTWGVGPVSTLVARSWALLYTLCPACVGGCRPIEVVPLLDDDRWHIRHRSVVVAWGVPSEVVVASPI